MAEETVLDDKSTAAPAAVAAESSPAKTNNADDGDLLGDIFMTKVEEIVSKHATSDGKEASSASEGEAKRVDGDEEEPIDDLEAGEKDKGEKKEDQTAEPSVPFHNHPRWKEVLKERDDAKSIADTTKAELDVLRPQAEGFVRLQEYCQKNNINDNEMQEALDLLALSKTDTKAFRERLQTYVDVIDYAQGTRLPDDLQEKVDNGAISEEDARELSRYRIQKEHFERGYKTNAAQGQQRLVTDITASINAWHMDNAKRDPGFNDPDRIAMLTDRIHSLWNVKQPTDVRSAIALAEQANADVKARLAKFRPTPPVRKHLPVNGSSTKPKSTTPVQTMDELEQTMYDYGMKRMAARKA